MQPPPIVEPRAFARVGVGALMLLAVLVASLDRLVGIDERVWRAVLFSRSPATDGLVDGAVELATHALTALFVVAVGLHVRTRGIASAWPWIVAPTLGLLASKTLKHLLTRERPSSLPDVALGYSFPSAHVMNSLVALLAVVALTRAFRRRSLWWGTSGLLVTIVVVGRVLLAHHWALDVVGGVLAALGLAGTVAPIVARHPFLGPPVLALALTVVFTVDHGLGDLGLRLPSPLVGRREAIVDVDVGTSLRPELAGDWKEATHEHPGGTLVWLEGAGRIPLDVAEPVVAGEPLRLALAGRPQAPLRAPVVTVVALNGRELARFVPFEGWRQYRFPIPSGLLRTGANEVGIEVRTPDGPWRFAVADVRLGRSLPGDEAPRETGAAEPRR